ncbi:MAG: methyltransferase [Thermoanaerobaculales bacterium]|jgi:16S rRNA (guanine1207-N2)-methyltransferase|nr:methyltransferase [Thermoanaerobaculales bacterium]
MSRRSAPDPAELVTDPGVLDATPTLEVFDHRAAAAVGGVAVVPHRGRWRDARKQGVEARGWFDDNLGEKFTQAVVHLQKGRAATEQGLAEAWSRLRHRGRLLLVGGNQLGVKSAVKRLTSVIGVEPEIVANRARSRVAVWPKNDAPITPPEIPPIRVVEAGNAMVLHSAPGVFSADDLDPGTALLLGHLDHCPAPERVFDPGCGLGVLGLTALRRWADASAVLADVDQRAANCARRNADGLGVAHRCEVAWWDAVTEAPPLARCDLVLLNPPFHTGVPVDLQPARAIFAAVDEVLAPGGRALIVANRTLPWERDLREIGRLRLLDDRRGYKVLELSR